MVILRVNEDSLGHRNWVTELKELLFVSGFDYIWNNSNRSDRDTNVFILSFERRLKDICIQNRFENVSNSHKLLQYKQYNISHSPFKYLDVLSIRNIYRYMYTVSSLRRGCHSLEIERCCHAIRLTCDWLWTGVHSANLRKLEQYNSRYPIFGLFYGPQRLIHVMKNVGRKQKVTGLRILSEKEAWQFWRGFS